MTNKVERIPTETQAMCSHPKPWRSSPEGWRCEACGQPNGRTLDGADREEWLAQWMENRLLCEGRHHSATALPHALTPEQIHGARALWLERYGAQRGAELHAKVAASAAVERNRVRVDLQDEP